MHGSFRATLPMRIIALHNASAGSQTHDGVELASRLVRGGHEVVRVVKRLDELERALHEERCDLVVVSGGDGTVGKAALAVLGTTIPIAIVPSGTANDLARSVGVDGDLDALVAKWPTFATRGLDAALATWSIEVADGAPTVLARRHVFECFGYGAVCEAMEEASAANEADPPADVGEKLARDRATIRRSPGEGESRS